MPQYALVTGASSGIGLELSRLLAQDHYNLILTARNKSRLNELADEFQSNFGIETITIPLDLTESDAARTLYKEVDTHQITPNILINNAGIASYGSFLESEWSDLHEMIQLNMQALTEITYRFLPEMVQLRSGKIMNVASTASFQPGPLMAVYYATKAYVLSFSEALAEELSEQGISVTSLCPGPTDTKFQQRAGMEQSRLVNNSLIMDAQTVAQKGYKDLMKEKRISIPGLSNKIGVFSTRFVPRKWLTSLVKMIQAEKN